VASEQQLAFLAEVFRRGAYAGVVWSETDLATVLEEPKVIGEDAENTDGQPVGKDLSAGPA
jgi:hypothetical protein